MVLPAVQAAVAVVPAEEDNECIYHKKKRVMKKKLTIIALAVLVATSVSAQTIYDAATIASKDLNGTARFVGMGGAMGALGGDISTIGTNPAGIGIYRSNDAMISFGYSSMGVESKFAGNKFSNDKNNGNFDNAGFVFSTKIGNQTTLRYVNFGFNYHKAKSFNKTTTMEGQLGYSQTELMAAQANGMFNDGVDLAYYTEEKINPYDDRGRAGWLGALGWDAELFLTDDHPTHPFYPYPYVTNPYANYRSEERGGVDQYDFNIAFNFNDRVYLGITIGAYDVNYRKTYYYGEDISNDGEYYDLWSENRIHGAGWDAKFGLIVRPFEESPLRLGLAIHTPTFYKLTYTTEAEIGSNLWYTDNETGEDFLNYQSYSTYYELGDKKMNREFELRSPWTYNLSLGYTVGRNLALGAEYEHQNYSSMKFYYPEGDEMPETDQVKNYLKGVNTFRIGAEYKVIPEFAFRLGYNYSSAVFENNAVKALPANSLNVDTDYANTKSLSNYTLGIGYRGSSFYADLAYKYTTQKADFYPFALPTETGAYDVPAVTKVTNSRSQVILTLGMRF